jgi:hypothetical protein
MLGAFDRGQSMIRKMILPALAAALLAGCASYQYRSGAGGDYYYGQPSADYQYYGSPYYGSPYYRSPYGWGGSVGYSYGYYPYGSGYVRYYPHYQGYPRYPHHGGHDHGSSPGTGTGSTPEHDRHRKPSWRDLGALRDSANAGQRQSPTVRGSRTTGPTTQSAAPPRRSMTAPRAAIRASHSKRDHDRNSTP